MSILDWIEKTREKPEPVRRKIALAITILIMAVIIFVWVTSSFV